MRRIGKLLKRKDLLTQEIVIIDQTLERLKATCKHNWVYIHGSNFECSKCDTVKLD